MDIKDRRRAEFKRLSKAAATTDTQPSEENTYQKHKHVALVIWTVIGALIILWALSQVAGVLAGTLQIIIAAIIISFLCLPIVDYLELHGIHRGIGTLVAYLIYTIFLAIIVALFLPIVIGQLIDLTNAIP
ncbi:MAG: hypothetical protein Q4E22_02665, partial [Coriobacteriia bacterium]|nr:hypothetical protein [Coriobacteriia bacterium]